MKKAPLQLFLLTTSLLLLLSACKPNNCGCPQATVHTQQLPQRP